jgi:chorismate mutase/prephenate dehydratase
LSHPQALAQCSDFIRRQGWAVRETLNTAFAAEEVAGSGDGSLAAIASQTAAQATGLAVLRSDISNTSGNQTRFIVVGREFTVTPDAERISLILKLPHTIGSLAATLAIFSDSGLNLSKIQSRPDIDNPWTYLFYLDFECRRQDLKRALATLYQLSCEMPFLRLLGWYGEVRP